MSTLTEDGWHNDDDDDDDDRERERERERDNWLDL